MFALYHVAWMAYVAKSDRVKDAIQNKIPPWNLLLWGLTTKETKKETNWYKWVERDSLYYKPREGYQWQAEKWYDNRHIPESDTYKPDKDVLTYILNR